MNPEPFLGSPPAPHSSIAGSSSAASDGCNGIAAYGACVVIGLVASGPILFAVLFGGLIVTLVVATVYSYRILKIDPDRQSVGRDPVE